MRKKDAMRIKCVLVIHFCPVIHFHPFHSHQWSLSNILNSYSVNKIWFAAEDNQGCRRHFGDSQWRLMESGQIKVLGTTDISCWQKHRSWFKANFSSKTARASVCIGNYQFCPHWQTGVQYRIVCMRRRRRVRRWNPNFCGRAPTRA